MYIINSICWGNNTETIYFKDTRYPLLSNRTHYFNNIGTVLDFVKDKSPLVVNCYEDIFSIDDINKLLNRKGDTIIQVDKTSRLISNSFKDKIISIKSSNYIPIQGRIFILTNIAIAEAYKKLDLGIVSEDKVHLALHTDGLVDKRLALRINRHYQDKYVPSGYYTYGSSQIKLVEIKDDTKYKDKDLLNFARAKMRNSVDETNMPFVKRKYFNGEYSLVNTYINKRSLNYTPEMLTSNEIASCLGYNNDIDYTIYSRNQVAGSLYKKIIDCLLVE